MSMFDFGFDDLEDSADKSRLSKLVKSYERDGKAAYFDSDALEDIATFYFEHGRFEDALGVVDRILETQPYSSDGWMRPEQLIKWHIANNFNAFVLTDHNTGKNNNDILSFQKKYPEILIIPGFEWTSSRLHMNLLGIKDFPFKVPQFPSDEQIKEAMDKAQNIYSSAIRSRQRVDAVKGMGS